MQEWVKRLRASAGLSQQAFATELGVSIQTIVRWEGGHKSPAPLARRALASFARKRKFPEPMPQ